MGITTNALPTIDEWMSSHDTGNVLHDMAVAEVAFAQALGGAVTQARQLLQDTSDKIKDMNALSDLLRAKRSTGQATDGGPAFTAEEAARITAGLAKYCPSLGASVAAGGALQQATVDQWLNSLSGASQDQTTVANKINATVQSLVSGFDSGMQAASGDIRKNEQIGGTIANNYRAA